VKEVSSITHGHLRSVLRVSFILNCIGNPEQKEKWEAYRNMQRNVREFWITIRFLQDEMNNSPDFRIKS
jgi:hypothetical protein